MTRVLSLKGLAESMQEISRDCCRYSMNWDHICCDDDLCLILGRVRVQSVVMLDFGESLVEYIEVLEWRLVHSSFDLILLDCHWEEDIAEMFVVSLLEFFEVEELDKVRNDMASIRNDLLASEESSLAFAAWVVDVRTLHKEPFQLSLRMPEESKLPLLDQSRLQRMAMRLRCVDVCLSCDDFGTKPREKKNKLVSSVNQTVVNGLMFISIFINNHIH